MGGDADRFVCLLAVRGLLACRDFHFALGAFKGRDGLVRVQQGAHVVLAEGLFGELVEVAVGVVVAKLDVLGLLLFREPARLPIGLV